MARWTIIRKWISYVSGPCFFLCTHGEMGDWAHGRFIAVLAWNGEGRFLNKRTGISQFRIKRIANSRHRLNPNDIGGM
jgi:hypothetical protein